MPEAILLLKTGPQGHEPTMLTHPHPHISIRAPLTMAVKITFTLNFGTFDSSQAGAGDEGNITIT